MRQLTMARRKGDSDTVKGLPPVSRTRNRGDVAVGKRDRYFETWLDKSLPDLYDGVTNEPIPESLLKLLDDSKKG